MAVLPDIVPGVAGMTVLLTPNVCAEEVPQELLAVTEMFPLEEPAVVLIEFVVEAPVHPDGKVQL